MNATSTLLLRHGRRITAAIVLIIIAVAIAAPTASARVYAVCVGIDRYAKRGVPPLHYATSDARSMAKFLSDNSSGNVTMVLGKNATRTTILRTIESVFGKAKADDTVIFYFSGHGLEGAMCTYDSHSPSTLLTYRDLGKAMKRTRARTKLIIADTCHSGSGRIAKRSDARPQDIDGNNIVLFLASRSKETANESLGMRGGLFTLSMLQGFRGAADKNGDRAITAREIFDYVSNRVVRLSRGRQHPVMWGKFSPNLVMISY